MSEESTTPNLVELTREFFTTATRQDIDALVRFYASDAVWDMGRGIDSGLEMDETDANVFTLRDGKVVCWQNLNDQPDALKAVGLAE